MTKFSPITVFAAASLKKTFTEVGEQFKTDNPSADTNNMVKAELLAGDPVNFASNTLTIVTAPGNPKKVASFADLNRPGVSVVVCAPQVPCGSATEKVERATGTELNKVTTGQVDVAVNTSPIAVLKDAPKPDLAQKLVDLVTGEHGQKVLSDAGFAKP
ncbi:MAG TPA: substrate-binding domain-containing protein [Mycobacterium sp.]